MSVLQLGLRLGIGFHGFALCCCQLLRNHYLNCHVVVTLLMMVGRQLLNTVVRDLFSFLVPCAWWNFDCDVAVECFYCEVCAKHSLANVQVQVCVDVGSFTLEVAVIAHLNVDYQVAVGASLTCMAFFGHSQVNSIVDTLWNVNRLFG